SSDILDSASELGEDMRDDDPPAPPRPRCVSVEDLAPPDKEVRREYLLTTLGRPPRAVSASIAAWGRLEHEMQAADILERAAAHMAAEHAARLRDQFRWLQSRLGRLPALNDRAWILRTGSEFCPGYHTLRQRFQPELVPVLQEGLDMAEVMVNMAATMRYHDFLTALLPWLSPAAQLQFQDWFQTYERTQFMALPQASEPPHTADDEALDCVAATTGAVATPVHAGVPHQQHTIRRIPDKPISLATRAKLRSMALSEGHQDDQLLQAQAEFAQFGAYMKAGLPQPGSTAAPSTAPRDTDRKDMDVDKDRRRQHREEEDRGSPQPKYAKAETKGAEKPGEPPSGKGGQIQPQKEDNEVGTKTPGTGSGQQRDDQDRRQLLSRAGPRGGLGEGEDGAQPALESAAGPRLEQAAWLPSLAHPPWGARGSEGSGEGRPWAGFP
ncbi:unnamed protein product, partial [Symbiodinium necroappetens]